ncbi:hypothetical protein FGO68_gene3646 [Halteria grandinella]|uniref:B box-type domain-containing protein n=1 Tax=Halteria grandinella TaxID=5974 RepID=A0A8J8T7G9_HALGN|nr:hypothetical protein FGO68_gene3646 [Halteria grandinella]
MRYQDGVRYQFKCPQCQKIQETHPVKLPCVYSILAHLPSNTNATPSVITFGNGNFNTESGSTPLPSHRQRQNQNHHQPNGLPTSANPYLTHQNSNNSAQPHPSSRTAPVLGNHHLTTKHSNSLPKSTACLRHPDKKVKYFCESDIAFLCSRCVLQHTGGGHLVQECRLDAGRVKNDFMDVKGKYVSLLDEAECTKGALEQAEKRLSDMCHKQVNKLEIAYKSIYKALEAKKKEFTSIIKEFYSDQRQKVSFDKQRASSFLTKALSHKDDLAHLECQLDDTFYEELFRTLSSKSQSISQLQAELISANHQLGRGAQQLERQLVYAIFLDKQLKISDYGTVQYIKASDYQRQKQSTSKPRAQGIIEHESTEGGGGGTQRGEMPSSHRSQSKNNSKKRHGKTGNLLEKERAKQWQLDEKTSKKLDQIINRVPGSDADAQTYQTKSKFKHDEVQIKENNMLLNIAGNYNSRMMDGIVMSSTTSVTSCLFNKNLLAATQQDEIKQTQTRMLNDYEKGARKVPILRTDMITKGGGLTQIQEESNEHYLQTTQQLQKPSHSYVTGGSQTQRTEYHHRQKRGLTILDENQDNGKQGSGGQEAYSKYLNPMRMQNPQLPNALQSNLQTPQNHNVMSPMTASIETTNPFENGLLFRQSQAPSYEEKQPHQAEQDTLQLIAPDFSTPNDPPLSSRLKSAKHVHKNLQRAPTNNEALSSDEELLSNMLQDISGTKAIIPSKSQERRAPTSTKRLTVAPENKTPRGGIQSRLVDEERKRNSEKDFQTQTGNAVSHPLRDKRPGTTGGGNHLKQQPTTQLATKVVKKNERYSQQPSSIASSISQVPAGHQRKASNGVQEGYPVEKPKNERYAHIYQQQHRQ